MEKGDLNNYLRGCASSYIKRHSTTYPVRRDHELRANYLMTPTVLSVNDLPHEDTKGPDVSQ